MYSTIKELDGAIQDAGALRQDNGTLHIINEPALREGLIEPLVYTAVFAPDPGVATAASALIQRAAAALGIRSASLHRYYHAIGRGDVVPTSTVPAVNLRTLTYDIARLIFRLKRELDIGPLILELARSEMGYTTQRPREFAVAVLAAAIREGYRGPVFLQGDHFQVHAQVYRGDAETELDHLRALIDEALDAQFGNIDLDASTLVDLTKTTLHDQQAENAHVTTALTQYIRTRAPNGVASIGGEIGHIGGRNSTPEELAAFVEGVAARLGTEVPGLSKISVQTGTSHGGIPLPDGTVADVRLDFSVLERTGRLARARYHLGGVVQHGASTLPLELFERFPAQRTLEIHLATGFQNTVFDQMPAALCQSMYGWVERELGQEWPSGWTREQFLYSNRKRAFGQFKDDLWHLTAEEKRPILARLEQQFRELFSRLNVLNTAETLAPYV